ncbi:MAG: hypothetical protein PHX30_05175 [Candidatus Pacebacteria bacterium]|nr:hypothetical protein [Candidatus Paceibacterota bacterium]
MYKPSKVFLKNIAALFVFCFCFLSVSYLAIAATDTVQVKQTVGEEGDGTAPETPTGGGIILPIDATPPEILNMRIYDIDLDSAKISFQTDEVCLVELYYGKAKIYEFGPLLDHVDSYEYSHDFALEGLGSGMKYNLKIVIKNQKGVTNTITDYSFYTIAQFKTIPAVGSLTAIQVGGTVVLNWDNPQVAAFQGVQISRQIGAPALGPNEGEKVFFGLAENFVDTNVADNTEYYYTVFAFDAGGKFSSGVTVSIRTNFPSSGGGETPEDVHPPVDNTGDEEEPTAIVSPLKDVRNLQVSADLEKKTMTLHWEYAEIAVASAVEIRRDLNFPSMSPLEGELIYAGNGKSFEDDDIRKGQIYFYTVYVKDEKGRYSGGAMIAAELKETATESPESDRWQDMNLVDVKSGISISIQDGDKINVLQKTILGVSYGVDSVPSNLAAVAIQIGDVSYLLNYSSEESVYKSSFVVPSIPGIYSFDMVFLNSNNEVFFEKDLQMQVVSRGEIYTYNREKLFSGEISLEKLWCRLGNLFGRENLYCMTQSSVSGAEIQIFRKNRDNIWEIWNAKEYNQENPFLTDESGRYSYFLPNGEYEIGVKKNGFDYAKVANTVMDNILAEDIRINVKKDKKYAIILLVILFIAIAQILRKRILDIEKR